MAANLFDQTQGEQTSAQCGRASAISGRLNASTHETFLASYLKIVKTLNTISSPPGFTESSNRGFSLASSVWPEVTLT